MADSLSVHRIYTTSWDANFSATEPEITNAVTFEFVGLPGDQIAIRALLRDVWTDLYITADDWHGGQLNLNRARVQKHERFRLEKKPDTDQASLRAEMNNKLVSGVNGKLLAADSEQANINTLFRIIPW